MKIFKLSNKNDLVVLVKNSILSLPTPYSISMLWNMGFLLGMCLVLQLVSGIMLSMNYVAQTDMSFDSVIHIMRDVNMGVTMRYMHSNGASLFFMIMFLHMGRGIYFNSTMKSPMVWASGIIIFLMTMATAFLGYVLPWGQMSFWGATVITSMISAIPYIGTELTKWVWGNFSVSQPTLNRFFSMHFLFPMVIMALVMVHLMMLHKNGSSNPTGTLPDSDKMKFFPYYVIKDLLPMMMCMFIMMMVISMSPNILGDVENFNKASITTTPPHIQPEWYFLFAYAILRSVPSKLGGVMAMVSSILILVTLSMKENKLNKKFSPMKKVAMWTMVSVVVMLTWIGANPVEPPFTTIGMMVSMLYFSMFLVL